MAEAIKTIRLTKVYRTRKRKMVSALQGLDLEVHKGEVFGLLGPNGAGKSTTIKIIMGLIQPTSGTVIINGQPARGIQYKQQIGYLPENPVFYDFLTGRELLFFVGRVFGISSDELSRQCDFLFELLDLKEAQKRPIRSYSKGMIQRLGLAQALIHNPDILILDEPMSGLDPVGRILVKDLILELKRQGKTIFMSTHILNDLEMLCDRVAILVKGRLKRIVNIDELMSEGIDSYRISFKSISPETAKVLLSTGASNINEKTYIVPKYRIAEILSRVSQDSRTELSLVEPQRKGLEELFKEVIREDVME